MHFITVTDFDDECEKAINVAYIKFVEPRKLMMDDDTEKDGATITMHDDEQIIVMDTASAVRTKLGMSS